MLRLHIIIIFLPMHLGLVPDHSFLPYDTPLSKCRAFVLQDLIDDSFGLIVKPTLHSNLARKFSLITSTFSTPLAGSFKGGHCSGMMTKFHEYRDT